MDSLVCLLVCLFVFLFVLLFSLLRFFMTGIQKEVHQCCLTATLALQVLIEHARIWGTSETSSVHFTELSSQLLDTVKRLAGHVIGIVEVRTFLV